MKHPTCPNQPVHSAQPVQPLHSVRHTADNRPYANISKLNFPIHLVARPRAPGFQTIFLDFMAIPHNLFDLFSGDESFRPTLTSFAKWRLDYAPPASPPTFTETQTAVLHVLQKILTRGRLTRLSPTLEAKISQFFVNVKTSKTANLSKATILTSYQNYHAPNLPQEWHDGHRRHDLGGMTAEEYFYKKVFLEIAGVANAKDILPQVLFRSLVLNQRQVNPAALAQRLDFLITHDQDVIAVEIDDPTHSNHREKDAHRDQLLEANGLSVYRVDVDELVHGGPALDALTNKLKQIYPSPAPSSAEKVDPTLVAIRLAHQFQLILIELARVGKIDPFAKTRISFDPANLPSLTSKQQKSVLTATLKDLRNLAGHLAKLYNLPETPFAGLTLGVKNPDLLISVNDNPICDPEKIVYLQDISYPLALAEAHFPKIPRPKLAAYESSLKFLLKYIFRFDDFRPNQIDGLLQTLDGEDSIVLLPTGSGKSIVYQLLAFILPGTPIVIDPIVSLIEDQVDNLRRQGIDRVLGITGSTENKTYLQNALQLGQYVLIFLSPERLQIASFRTALRNFCAWSVVPVCAIDEAHCVSEWGHDFRTSYLNLANTCRTLLKTRASTPVILALTGTASEAVLRDMERDLGIPDKYVIRPTSFDRQEIEFVIVPVKSPFKNEALREIIERTLPTKFQLEKDDFHRPNGVRTMSGIIFCPHVNGQYGVTQVLRDMENLGVKTEEYSGQRPKSSAISAASWDAHKSGVAQRYKDNAFPLLVATKSFGMGIDKPNIRYTIHYGLPQSIEAYYQEAGRAGRDRQPAYSFVIASNDFPSRNRALLGPSATLDQLVQTQKYRWDKKDDVTRALYFHIQTFSGIDGELTETKNVLLALGSLGASRSAVIASSARDRNKTERVLHRLSILGLVRDYTVDYSANEFYIVLNAFDRTKIIKSYGRYVRSYQDDDNYVRSAERLLEEISARSPSEFVLKAMQILLREFIYKIVESSRRQAFANLLDIVTKASAIPDETARSQFVRTEILKFLGNTHVDLVKQITDHPDNLAQIAKIIDNLTRKKQDTLAAELGRALEAYPQHPGLLLARTQLKLEFGDFDYFETADALLSVFDFSSRLYGSPPEAIIAALAKALDAARRTNEPAYLELINYLLQSDRLPDSAKDLLLDALPEKYRILGLLNRLTYTLNNANAPIRKETLWTAKK